MLVLSAKCDEEIPLDRAESSSSLGASFQAPNGIDNNKLVGAMTNSAADNWFTAYFRSRSAVGKVVVERGVGYDLACVYCLSLDCPDRNSLWDIHRKIWVSTSTVLAKLI